NQNSWIRDRVVVVMPDGTSLEWLAGTHKIVLSKPDNTHIHYVPNGSVSVFVENCKKRPPPPTGLSGHQPLLFFQGFNGTLAVRPSKRAPSANISKTKENDSPGINQPQDQQQQIVKRVFFTSLEGICGWVNSKNEKIKSSILYIKQQIQ
ncbi:MAG: hypothetical protein EZS28_008414, partial [Streblomastix strix]